MPNFIFTDANGQRQRINDQQLQALAAKGIIRPDTPLEAEGGYQGVAGQIPGLKFNTAAPPLSAPPAQAPSPSPSAPKQLYCTNCSKIVSEQAVACMSCGAKPTGHKKFCRQCGSGLNPEQVICVKCGAAISGGKSSADMAPMMSKLGGLCAPTEVRQATLKMTTFIYIGLVMFPLLVILLLANPFSDDVWATWVVNLLVIAMWLSILGACGVFAYLMLLFWNLVPRDIARTTPERAAMLSLIPLFNVYWVFICVWGLGKDLDSTLQQREIDSGKSKLALLGLVYCVFVTILFCVNCVAWSYHVRGSMSVETSLIYASIDWIMRLLFFVSVSGKGVAIYLLYAASKVLAEE